MNMHLPDALTIRDLFLGNLDLQLTVDFCLRLLLSCVCGGAIGIERSKHFKEAGVRTHVIVCMGAALAMIVSKYGFADLALDNGSYFPGIKEADPARIAAQVISGISFLGAGVIFKREGLVRGLTTAAGIWVTAAIGLAVGSGMLVVGLFAAQLEEWNGTVLESAFSRNQEDGTTDYDLTVRRRKEISYAEMKEFIAKHEEIISATNSSAKK